MALAVFNETSVSATNHDWNGFIAAIPKQTLLLENFVYFLHFGAHPLAAGVGSCRGPRRSSDELEHLSILGASAPACCCLVLSELGYRLDVSCKSFGGCISCPQQSLCFHIKLLWSMGCSGGHLAGCLPFILRPLGPAAICEFAACTV